MPSPLGGAPTAPLDSSCTSSPMFETIVLRILSDGRYYLHKRQDANRLTGANVAAKHSPAPLPPFTFTHPECGTELLQITVVSEWMKVRCQIFNIQPEEDQIGGI